MEKHVYKHNLEKIIFFEESGYSQIKAFEDKLEWGSSFTNLFGYRGTTLDGTVKIIAKTTNIFFEKIRKRIMDALENQELQTEEYIRKLTIHLSEKLRPVVEGITYIRKCYINRYGENSEHPGISNLEEFYTDFARAVGLDILHYRVLIERTERRINPSAFSNEKVVVFKFTDDLNDPRNSDSPIINLDESSIESSNESVDESIE